MAFWNRKTPEPVEVPQLSVEGRRRLEEADRASETVNRAISGLMTQREELAYLLDRNHFGAAISRSFDRHQGR